MQVYDAFATSAALPVFSLMMAWFGFEEVGGGPDVPNSRPQATTYVDT